MGDFGDCTCEHCEEVMQPFLDRELTPDELAEAQAHIEGCSYCARRYKFEEELRVLVKKACWEEMPPELKVKLAALRLPEP
jgi:anti-sigma factor (TIGR02949 family)